MTGSEAIKILGNKLYTGFDIDSEPQNSIYKKTYENFISGLNEENSGKGILLIGQIGVGKTAMMKIMQKLFKESARCFKWLTCNDLIEMMEHYTVSEIKSYYGKDLKMDLYIDDVGMGNATYSKFGNTTNIISEILLERYDLFVKEKFKTHISSNRPTALDKTKYPDIITLEDMFGQRVVDRLREMCEVIVWKGESLRK